MLIINMEVIVRTQEGDVETISKPSSKVIFELRMERDQKCE